MSYMEKIKKAGVSVKKFCKDHWKGLAVIGGTILTGATCYAVYNHKHNDEADTQLDFENYETIEDKTAWNEDWDAQALAFEFATHQPLGPFRKPGEDDDDCYMDPLEGNAYIIAGPNSIYNSNQDTVEIYVLDNDGYYHPMPDDLYNA